MLGAVAEPTGTAVEQGGFFDVDVDAESSSFWCRSWMKLGRCVSFCSMRSGFGVFLLGEIRFAADARLLGASASCGARFLADV